MNKTEFNDNITDKTEKKSWFWIFFFFLILPLIGVVVEVVALKLENVALMLLAMPMLLSFFITAGIIFYKAIKAGKEIEPSDDDGDEYYESNLNISETEIINSDENPYKKDAIKAVFMILLSVFVPLLFSYLLRNSELMILGLYVKNICSALPIFLGLCAVTSGWKHLANYFEFSRSKKILLSKQNGEKRPFVLPRINILCLLFFLLAVLMFTTTIQDINTLNDYKRNGVAVNAVSYRVETEGEDHYVYFKYTYDGKEYSYVKRNYPGGTKIGKEATAFIDPEKPEELFLYYSSSFAVYMLLTGALFFLWMGNGYRRSILIAGLLTEGIVAMILGFFAGTAGHKVWGVILLACALVIWVKGRKKSVV